MKIEVCNSSQDLYQKSIFWQKHPFSMFDAAIKIMNNFTLSKEVLLLGQP